jgi:hypothetical protein
MPPKQPKRPKPEFKNRVRTQQKSLKWCVQVTNETTFVPKRLENHLRDVIIQNDDFCLYRIRGKKEQIQGKGRTTTANNDFVKQIVAYTLRFKDQMQPTEFDTLRDQIYAIAKLEDIKLMIDVINRDFDQMRESMYFINQVAPLYAITNELPPDPRMDTDRFQPIHDRYSRMYDEHQYYNAVPNQEAEAYQNVPVPTVPAQEVISETEQTLILNGASVQAIQDWKTRFQNPDVIFDFIVSQLPVLKDQVADDNWVAFHREMNIPGEPHLVAERLRLLGIPRNVNLEAIHSQILQCAAYILETIGQHDNFNPLYLRRLNREEIRDIYRQKNKADYFLEDTYTRQDFFISLSQPLQDDEGDLLGFDVEGDAFQLEN